MRSKTDVDNLKAEAVMRAVLENAQRLIVESESKSAAAEREGLCGQAELEPRTRASLLFGLDPGADAVLGNAERLLTDAAILAQHGSCQSALSLAALSFEESGKSCIIRWRNAGLLTRNIRKEIKALHKMKQCVFCAYIYAKALCDFAKKEKDPLSRFQDLGKSAVVLIHDEDLLTTYLMEGRAGQVRRAARS
ncbi:MAG TPA: AbiV family abortive infection protein [Chthoniobacterales bacterium]